MATLLTNSIVIYRRNIFFSIVRGLWAIAIGQLTSVCLQLLRYCVENMLNYDLGISLEIYCRYTCKIETCE